jgi:hypothetical protein
MGTEIRDVSTSNENSFEIKNTQEHSVWTLQATEENAHKDWVTALQQAVVRESPSYIHEMSPSHLRLWDILLCRNICTRNWMTAKQTSWTNKRCLQEVS